MSTFVSRDELRGFFQKADHPMRTIFSRSYNQFAPCLRRVRAPQPSGKRPVSTALWTSLAHERNTPTSRSPVRRTARTRFLSGSVCRQYVDADFSGNDTGVARESEEVDVCIVGGGPAGLSAAIRLMQLAQADGNEDFRVVVLEKGSEIGAHILSGNVLEPRAIEELIPDWLDSTNESRFEHATPTRGDRMRFLTSERAIPIPTPPQMHNKGNYIISLSQFTRWLADRAEDLGVEIYPGFAGADLLHGPDGTVQGVVTNDQGLGKDGQPKENYEPGMEFRAKVTLLAEGCHGSLTKKAIAKFRLRRDCQPQTYGLGIKEVWEVLPDKFQAGEIFHSMGYPLSKDVYGGGWLYHYGDNLVSVGLVVGLDYANPWISPYGEFQRLKSHPAYRSLLEGGRCLAYGARALNEGGFQSIPRCVFPGGALIGDTAGFLNVPKVKGTHTSMKSGMLAAETAYTTIERNKNEYAVPVSMDDYEDKIRTSWIWSELKSVRNIRPSFHTPLGIYGGLLWSGLEAFIFRGRIPYTLKHKGEDYAATRPADHFAKIDYPKPDNEITFDILTSVHRTGTYHQEDEPCHLVPQSGTEGHARQAYPLYQGVENRFCPANVYHYISDETRKDGVQFRIESQNCIHCKTCSIKDPTQDITWTVPEGSGVSTHSPLRKK